MKQVCSDVFLKKMNINRKLVAFMGLALFAASSQAAVVFYTDASAWGTGVGSATIDTQTFTIGGTKPSRQGRLH
jgi:hypothetical protein